jgi:hypothetical protein
MYKLVSVLAVVLSVYFTNAQTYCFQSEDDVMTYVIGKTFESKDGQVSIKFNSSEAILKAGANNLTYMYDEFNYLGGGHKGLVNLTELGGSGGLRLYVSCKEKMMTDNKGTLLYEKGTIGNSSSSNSTVKKGAIGNSSSSNSTVKIGNLEVMTKNLGEMNWDDAMKACATLGDGWRLPTKEEFNILYQNKDKIGGFNDTPYNNDYWSSTEGGYGYASYFAFGSGSASSSGKSRTLYVRAVRAF